MDESALLKALSSAPGGVALAAVLVVVLYKVLARMAERYVSELDKASERQERAADRHVAALDRVCAAVAEHTRVDLEHHAAVRETVVRLEAKVDTALGITPTGGHPRVEADADFSADRPPSRPRRQIRRRDV